MVKYNIIELDMWSKFGCFNKPFSSGGGLLTYLIPPKTSIIGIIGAILGYPFDDFELKDNIKYYSIEKLNDIKVSIHPLFQFKIKRVTFNNVSENIIMNVQQDIIINPYYKIYILFPDSLNDKEKLFLDRVKSNKSFYNLYMGRNEFLLNIEFKNVLSCDKFILNNSNSDEFFKSNKNKIYGSLNRKNVKSTQLKQNLKNSHRTLVSRRRRTFNLESYYEYIINQYPITRTNFTDFEYSPISFYAYSEDEDCFFADLELKNVDDHIDLYNIGDLKWISMI